MARMQMKKVAKLEEFGSVNQWQNGTMAAINNQTQSMMSLDRYQNWAGIPSTGSFPETIPPNGSAQFCHLRGGEYGSIGGVQYSGLNASDIMCAWILAWESPVQDSPPCPPNKVYVACGSKAAINAMTWDEIMINLDASPSYDTASDSATKTTAYANINDLTPNTATLVANFTFIG